MAAPKTIRRSNVTVTMDGPLFNGLAAGIIRAFQVEMVAKVATMGENEVKRRLDRVLKRPTGHYRSKIQTNRVAPERVIISDGRVVYGSWLEGTSSRNESTRFKGYSTFRKTRLWLRRTATPEAQLLFDRRYAQKLGGS